MSILASGIDGNFVNNCIILGGFSFGLFGLLYVLLRPNIGTSENEPPTQDTTENNTNNIAT